jgi:hypothetical protein
MEDPMRTHSASFQHPLSTHWDQEASQQKVHNESFIDAGGRGTTEWAGEIAG